MNDHPFDEYFKYYIGKVKHQTLSTAFQQSYDEMNHLLKLVEEQEKWGHSYAEGKWTVGQLLLHIMDTDRIMGYRALSFSRGESLELPGYDHETYAEKSNFMDYDVHRFKEEYLVNRRSLELMFANFSKEMMSNSGSMNGRVLHVEGVGYLICGHQQHHVEV
ncbi:MAG: DinB family protein, partial [Bacteroidota bacterium]